MVMTSAEDGSVRVFHCGLKVHDYLMEANSFDRMTVPVHRISSSSQHTASLSRESAYVSYSELQTTVMLYNISLTLHVGPIAVRWPCGIIDKGR